MAALVGMNVGSGLIGGDRWVEVECDGAVEIDGIWNRSNADRAILTTYNSMWMVCTTLLRYPNK